MRIKINELDYSFEAEGDPEDVYAAWDRFEGIEDKTLKPIYADGAYIGTLREGKLTFTPKPADDEPTASVYNAKPGTRVEAVRGDELIRGEVVHVTNTDWSGGDWRPYLWLTRDTQIDFRELAAAGFTLRKEADK